MKKTLRVIAVIAILGTILFLLTGCNSKEEEIVDVDIEKVATETKDNGNSNASSVESLLDWMKGGKFSYDFTMTNTYEGESSTSSGSFAIDGDNFAIATETTTGGITSKARIVQKDGAMYLIEETSKIIMKMPATQGLGMAIPTEYESMEVINTGTGEVDGKTLPYEEFDVDGFKSKYYMEKGQVYAIESEGEGATSLMIIKNAKNSVPAGAFDIPTEGYTQL